MAFDAPEPQVQLAFVGLVFLGLALLILLVGAAKLLGIVPFSIGVVGLVLANAMRIFVWLRTRNRAE